MSSRTLRIMQLAATLAAATALAPAAKPPLAAQARSVPTIAERTAGMKAMPGFFALYWDEATARLYWEIDRLDTEFLYQVSMASGLGSNPVGIDRGQLGGTYVLVAKQTGPRVLLLEPNYRFQARDSRNPKEVEAVRDAFAPSVHWGFDVVAQTGRSVLVDATGFFLRDARGVIQQLARTGQGSFSLDASRSALHPDAIKSFPKNTEVEALLTFTSSNPGALVRGVAASGDAVTLRQHHSFIALPDGGYTPRVSDPRIGVNGPDVMDFAQPVDRDVFVHFASRFRLKKRNPSAARSEPVTPITFYVDPGIPEPVRSAVIEGTRWWNQAFEAAGYLDAFRVAVLPDSADPDDIRYNLIHWNHRRTRGYSYGMTVEDPRTGEILRGNVNLGSLRLRQDYLHGVGMVPPFGADGGTDGAEFAEAPSVEYLAAVAEKGDALEMALARVRQLAAHEVGHTIGFPHNYIGSAQNRSTVMDYPAPLPRITPQGGIDLSEAYAKGIGEYDKLSVTWLYQDFPPGTDETAALAAIAESGLKRGLRYVGHWNNNFIGAGHQFASVWDNGANLVDQLVEELKVRKIGLDRFGPEVIRPGEAMSRLEFALLPLYMHHRFQLRAAAQSLGGADYTNALRGDGQVPYTVVPVAEQRRALEVILGTLTPDFLALPERIVKLIPPPADRREEGEGFQRHTELLFDPIAAAEASAAFSVGEILHPQRMARLVSYGSLGDSPPLEEVVDRLVAATWGARAPRDRYRAQLLRAVQRVVADQMMVMGSRGDVSPAVRAVLGDRLDALARRLERVAVRPAHESAVLADIRRWQRRPEQTIPGPA
ncbi:MAG TPA: zinc-dependent metalloprotease, partial [Gemmatimonadaceae bacterium]|nr:zinc-dependent metalloprotease [Gemmatimonadaceae bacterium]